MTVLDKPADVVPPPAHDAAHPDVPTAHAQTATGFHRFLEIACTFIFPFALLATCWPVATTLHNQGLLWLGALILPLTWLSADVVAGTVHWTFDTYFTEDTPVLGKNFVQPFREHHVAPKNITLHDIPSTIGNSCILGMILQPIFFAWAYLTPDSVVSALIILFISFTFAASAATNLFHKWAHDDASPGWVRALQSAGLILAPRHHQIHHTPPFDTYYCITCGWMNPILAKIRYFRGLEAALRMIGVEPNIER